MHANLASIMPQVVALWCEQEGHDVSLTCYTGFEDLSEELPEDVDIVFISSFTQAAQQAYALSNRFRTGGAVTVLGGPHARCYPQDAQKYFDYVLGFTDKSIIHNVLSDCSPHRPMGLRLAAPQQPKTLPGVRERWKFIEPTIRKAPFLKIVPMIASMGCPYTCDFCIDSTVSYEPLEMDVIKEDLRFLLTKFKKPRVAWHDPNFGIRFGECLDAIEDAVPPGSVEFIAESTLSLLTEERLKRLKRNGFKAILPGIESWFDLGDKSKTGAKTGLEKVKQISDHVNMVMKYIPYVQANFVLGMDNDEGPEPFELTKRFLDLTPGAFPGYSLLTAFGEAAPLNLDYQRDNRILPFPHHFLNNNHAMNVRPKNYSWEEFYDHVIDLVRYSFSRSAIMKRIRANKGVIVTAMNLVRAISSEGSGRLRYHREIRRRLNSDLQMHMYFEQETAELPEFYVSQVRKDLGPFWEWLPKGSLHHNPNAYLESVGGSPKIPALEVAENGLPEAAVGDTRPA
jgi:hypothetical protein